jgi:hypothetical protein
MTFSCKVFWYWLQCKVFIVLHEDDKLFVLESSIYTILVEFFSIPLKKPQSNIGHTSHLPTLTVHFKSQALCPHNHNQHGRPLRRL